MISAHWEGNGLAVTGNKMPPTIHDFGNFGEELFVIQYPAPGSPELCQRVQSLLSPEKVEISNDWGLDHGAWTILYHIYPNHDVPVV